LTLTLANSFSYLTWGKPDTTGTHNGYPDLGFRFRYVGRSDVQWDDVHGLGLYYMHARHYSPTLGRFLQPDPSAAEANLYGYAANGPVTNVDPDGLIHIKFGNTGGSLGAAGARFGTFRMGTQFRLVPRANSSAGRPIRRGGESRAAREGRRVHKEFEARLKNKPGWRGEQRIRGKDGRWYKPDGETPSGRYVELKPRTPSGRRAGKRQARIYEEQLGRKTRVIYYDP
jgi:RHS repeat-associated protein